MEGAERKAPPSGSDSSRYIPAELLGDGALPRGHDARRERDRALVRAVRPLLRQIAPLLPPGRFYAVAALLASRAVAPSAREALETCAAGLVPAAGTRWRDGAEDAEADAARLVTAIATRGVVTAAEAASAASLCSRQDDEGDENDGGGFEMVPRSAPPRAETAAEIKNSQLPALNAFVQRLKHAGGAGVSARVVESRVLAGAADAGSRSASGSDDSDGGDEGGFVRVRAPDPAERWQVAFEVLRGAVSLTLVLDCVPGRAEIGVRVRDSAGLTKGDVQAALCAMRCSATRSGPGAAAALAAIAAEHVGVQVAPPAGDGPLAGVARLERMPQDLGRALSEPRWVHSAADTSEVGAPELDKALRSVVEMDAAALGVVVAHVENVMRPCVMRRFAARWREQHTRDDGPLAREAAAAGEDWYDACRRKGANAARRSAAKASARRGAPPIAWRLRAVPPDTRELLAPAVGYHGTRPHNLTSIAASGLLAHGDETEHGEPIVRASLDRGCLYGDGVYVSRDVERAAAYSGDAGVGSRPFRIVCALVLPGVAYQVRGPMRSPRPGYDSYVTPGGRVRVLFRSDQVMPAFIVTLVRSSVPRSLPDARAADARKSLETPTVAPAEMRRRSNWQEAFRKRHPLREVVHMLRLPGGDGGGAGGRGARWLVDLSADDRNLEADLVGDPDAVRPVAHTHTLVLAEPSPAARDAGLLDVLNGVLRGSEELRGPAGGVIWCGRRLDTVLRPGPAYASSPEARAAAGADAAGGLLRGIEHAVAAVLDAEELWTKQTEDLALAGARAAVAARVAAQRNAFGRGAAEARASDDAMTPSRRDVRDAMRRVGRTRGLRHEVVVLFGDGRCPAGRLEAALEVASKQLRGCGAKVCWRLVALGPHPDVRAAARAKLALQTQRVPEPGGPLELCPKPSHAAHVGQRVAAALTRSNAAAARLDVDLAGVDGSSGFVRELRFPPEPSATLGPLACAMYRGTPPLHMWLHSLATGRVSRPTVFVHGPGSSMLSDERVVRLLRSLVADVMLSACAGRDVDAEVTELLELADAIKVARAAPGGLRGVGPAARMEAVRRRRGLVNDLEHLLNGLRGQAALARTTMSAGERAAWLASASRMAFGARAARVAARASAARRGAAAAGDEAAGGEVRCVETADGGAESARRAMAEAVAASLERVAEAEADAPRREDHPREARSVLSGLTARGHLAELVDYPRPLPRHLDVLEMLYAFSAVGVGVRLRRSEASVIDPWMIQVEHVSPDAFDTASSLCHLQSGVVPRDSAGEACPDVLLPAAPADPVGRSELHRAYLAAAFTRNPALALPAQYSALVHVAFVRGIEQLMLYGVRARRGGGDAGPGADYEVRLVRVLLRVAETVRIRGDRELMARVLAADAPAAHLTEAGDDDVRSVCKVLAPLCALDAAASGALFGAGGEERLRRLAMALMSEAVSRGVRRQVRARRRASDRSDDDTAERLVRRTLGLRLPEGDPEAAARAAQSSEYDLDAGRARSGVFFVRRWTNASPMAVVACLEFARARHELGVAAAGGGGGGGDTSEALAARMRAATMRSFVERFAPGCPPAELQVALYAQALRHHKSRTRGENVRPLDDPAAVLRQLSSDTRRRHAAKVAAEAARAARMEARSVSRATRLRREAGVFWRFHSGAPRIFSYADLDEENARRPPGAQLEGMPGGLLRHRCCYPMCPEYLVDQSTEEDRLLGRRKGFFRHIRFMLGPDRSYVAGLHAAANQLLRGPGARRRGVEVFTRELAEAVRWRKALMPRGEFEEVAAEIYRQMIGKK